MTTDETYPVRQIADFTPELASKSIFVKIDLLKGYHQIPVADKDDALWAQECRPGFSEADGRNPGRHFQGICLYRRHLSRL